MALYFARHGQTNWNRVRRWQSRTDIPLNQTGRRQARALSQLIRSRDIVFKRVVCSPLSRARETAEILMDGFYPALEIDSRLVELDLGEFEGRLESELGKELGERYDAWKSQRFTESSLTRLHNSWFAGSIPLHSLRPVPCNRVAFIQTSLRS